jgi:rhamnose transport system permease protein
MNGRNVAATALKAREFPILVALAAVVVITGLVNPTFASSEGISAILIESSVIGLLAASQSMLIIMRQIDLSVGSTTGLVAFLVGQNAAANIGVPFAVSVGVGLAVGLAVGIVNGFLIAYLGLPSLVVTIAMLYVVRGVFSQLAGGETITAEQVPAPLVELGSGSIFGVPYLFVCALIGAISVTLLLRYSRWGRDLYAIGSNPEAALRVGIPVARRTFVAFALSGIFTGVAGLLLLGRFSFADATSGLGIELYVIAACVIGGVAIAGGVGTAVGALIGAVLLQTITFALGALGVSQFWQQAVAGALLVLAITFDRVVAVRSARRVVRQVEVLA